MAKRIIVIESESEELINRFADKCDIVVNVQPYKDEVDLTHFKED